MLEITVLTWNMKIVFLHQLVSNLTCFTVTSANDFKDSGLFLFK